VIAHGGLRRRREKNPKQDIHPRTRELPLEDTCPASLSLPPRRVKASP
jgi:hypothetical protein